MKTLKFYAQTIEENKDNPGLLVELGEQLSADYMFCADALIPIKLKKAVEWVGIKRSEEKPLSDTLTDMLWAQTKDGADEIRLKYRMKALEKALASIKSHIFVLNNQAKNNY